MRFGLIIILMILGMVSCKKDDHGTNSPPVNPTPFQRLETTINGSVMGSGISYDVTLQPLIKFKFNKPVNRSSSSQAFSIKDNEGTSVGIQISYDNNDSTVLISPTQNLRSISKYQISLAASFKSVSSQSLSSPFSGYFITRIDSTNKFPIISDDSLLTRVQKQTFKYFWDFGHPVSGMARERNSSGDIVTTGGTGFGVMAILVGINRGFISRDQGLERIQTIIGFLKNTAQRFHGAYPHWLDGATGEVIPFSTNDDGADLVETSFLMQGLICVRQFFNLPNASELNLRTDIDAILNGVEWDWFRQGNQNVLYWHWSPNSGWSMNMPIRGYNECLITYIMAASSTTHPVPASVYTQGWANNGGIINGSSYYGYTLPLGPAYGGPLFFAHYSFLGMSPVGLSDAYANYWTQNANHTMINRAYCIANPLNEYGYSNMCWGLTASDIPGGYAASSPTNDHGVIAPTAAISSMPYTPSESMDVLKFLYYKLGDRLWGEYGFYDSFSLKDAWFATSTLAIDQGPMIIMIENYRTGLLWNLFTSAPEIVNGMNSLGFTAPYL